jgi:hypothetical protein
MYDDALRVAKNYDPARMADRQSTFSGIPFLRKNLVAGCQGAPFNEDCHAVKGYVSGLRLAACILLIGFILWGCSNGYRYERGEERCGKDQYWSPTAGCVPVPGP